jgi:tRNA1(Val) A37 N6-methylase TrmN6
MTQFDNMGVFEFGDYNLNTYCVPSELMDQVITQKYDHIISCPPYYDLEIYSGSDQQSTDLYKTYEEWLEKYWRQTVIASKSLLKENGIFAFIMGHNIRYRFMANDMIEIVKQERLQLINQIKIMPKKKTNSIHSSSIEKYEVCSYFIPI